MKEITLLMPVYNEAKNIERVIEKYTSIITKKIPCNVMICEDGSTDGTKDVLKKLEKKYNLTLITGEERKGYPRAAKDALSNVKSDIVFFIDSDDQYNPENLWEGLELLKNNDFIIGKRKVQQEKFYRIMLTKGFNFILRLFFGIPAHDSDCGFRIIKKSVIDAVLQDVHCLPYSFTSELLVRAHKAGFKVKEMEIDHFERGFGETKVYAVSMLPKVIMLQLKGVLKLWKELR